MKKVPFPSLFRLKKLPTGLFVFCLFVLSIISFLFFDFISLCFDSKYGHYHFPKNREIPFFRLGEREMGKIGEWGIREGSFKPEASCKYLLLGDSQTFGSGIFWKDTFSEILNRETDCHWTNAGIPGFTLENEFSLYQTIKSDISFDRVYLFIYGNDIYETGDTPDYLHYVKKQTWYIQFLTFFFPEQSRIYLKARYFQTIQKRMESELERVSKLEIKKQKSSNRVKEEFITLRGLYNLSPDYLSGSLDTKTYAKTNFNRWNRVLEQLYGKVLVDKKELVMVYIPLEVEYDPIRFKIYKEIGFVMNPKWIDSDSDFITDLKAISRKKNIPLIDLREYMRYRSDLLQKEDIHLNETATRLIANILKQKL
ncbi:SGNH/GDSL hydrolase family protein [Leptospira sp. 201903074]|uniref:SGNH/GDSL hydrolase family protein n=1 Tax=Leptospira abararensis TaxID=2810036 RepID=UPI001964A01E|nr:SGNH/GDSL hydrolase family protein [Leptospira abararensis]MBM9546516.1 SGNH/GDSL hydrolase family protein [Leptospira abararensis]